MLLKILGFLLIFFGSLHILLVILHKLHFRKMKDNVKLSHYVAVLVISMFIYIVAAILIAIFSVSLFTKIIMILFALTPFIIGKLATYEKEKFYSFLQMILIAISFLCI